MRSTLYTLRIDVQKDYYRVRLFVGNDFRYQWNDWESYFLYMNKSSEFGFNPKVKVVSSSRVK